MKSVDILYRYIDWKGFNKFYRKNKGRMLVDSTPLKDLNLTCEQTIRVNDCLLRATHDVHKLSFPGDNANDISEDVTSVCLQFQSVMFRSENTLEVYKSHLVPLLMKRVKIDGEDEGNEVEDHPMATVDVRYCKEIFKFYLKDLDASALLEYLISEFDWSVVDEFSSMTQLLVPYINEDKQIKGLIRFCVSRLKEISANDTSYTDVRALVYLVRYRFYYVYYMMYCQFLKLIESKSL